MRHEVKESRKFGLLIALIFMLIAAYLYFRKHQISDVLLLLSTFFLAASLLFPQKLIPVKEAWEKFGHILGLINTTIILTLIFYLILTPISLLMRLLHKDPLKLKINLQTNTYWENSSLKQNQFEQQF